jgi:hypothetical protein
VRQNAEIRAVSAGQSSERLTASRCKTVNAVKAERLLLDALKVVLAGWST